jgi:ATP-dependent Clp protease ATP-binding subunit ClpA
VRVLRRRRSPGNSALRLATGSYLAAAAEGARSLGHDHVGTEHMLLALAQDEQGEAGRALSRLGISAADVRAGILTLVGPCKYHHRRPIDADALATLGIDLDEVRRRVEAAFGPGALDRTWTGCLSVAPRLKQALEAAYRESGGAVPGSGAVLLALAAVEDSVAAQLLRQRSVTVDEVREALN